MKINNQKPSKESSQNERIRSRATKSRNNNRRKKMSIIIIFLVLLIVIISFFAFFFMFRIKQIQVEGATLYTQEQIIDSSGIKLDDNIFLINEEAVEKAITSSCAYIGSVQFVKVLPDELKLLIQETSAEYAVYTEEGYVLFDSTGKVLDRAIPTPPDTSLLVSGFSEIHDTVGGKISKDDAQFQAFLELASAIKESSMQGLTYLEFSDPNNLNAVYAGRVTLLFGNQENLSGKFLLAIESIKKEDQINSNRAIIMDLKNPKRAHVIDSPSQQAIPTEADTDSLFNEEE